jgi:hypothetical protein
LCHNGIVYARNVDDQTLNFSVSGMLWKRSLVMQDAETKSLWSHLLGKAMQGSLKGTQLQQIPSIMTDWATWRKRYPDTSVVNMDRTSEEFRREFYDDPRKFVLGVADGAPKAWSFVDLIERPIANDTYNGTPVVVAFDKASQTATVFQRRLGDQTLTFALVGGEVIDQQTKSQWDLVRGQATSGLLKGKQLKPVAAIVSYLTAWLNFHPGTEGLSRDLIRRADEIGGYRWRPR